MKGKNLQPRILDPANSHSDLTEKSKNFTDKEKVREFSTTRPAFLTNAKGTSLGRKEEATTRNKKIMNEKLTGKGKPTLKVANIHTQI